MWLDLGDKSSPQILVTRGLVTRGVGEKCSPQLLAGLSLVGSRGLGRTWERRMHTGAEEAPCKGGTAAAQPAHDHDYLDFLFLNPHGAHLSSYCLNPFVPLKLNWNRVYLLIRGGSRVVRQHWRFSYLSKNCLVSKSCKNCENWAQRCNLMI